MSPVTRPTRQTTHLLIPRFRKIPLRIHHQFSPLASPTRTSIESPRLPKNVVECRIDARQGQSGVTGFNDEVNVLEERWQLVQRACHMACEPAWGARGEGKAYPRGE